ncbi:hypothetical protein BDN70DRAFT_887462 [Pholiota conissans]|uniref:DUF6534 domain-containing protein n=1 Tax=Pholiota conissans TaxID=109636 RepID=A0A9P6CTE8_9AGAR|nr:hypothetical protein BDN70DRAFT_887462 [Pholiota conissans]
MGAFDDTLGAAFLGGLAAAVFYGLTSVQTFIYFQNCAGDRRSFRAWIFILWIVDSAHLALTAHGLYFYLVTNFGKLEALLAPTWSILVGIYLTNISDMIVRCFFAKRIFALCGPGRPFLRFFLPILVLVLALVVFVCGCTFGSKAFVLKTFERVNEPSVQIYLYASFAAGVAADSIVAISLCVLLYQSRTGLKRTDSLLTILMFFTINTGLLTSICALGCLITYAIWPFKFIFIGIYFALSKLYVNSLLASLNARNSLRARDERPTTADTARSTRFEAAGPTSLIFPMQRTTLSAATSGSAMTTGSVKETIAIESGEV